MPMDIHPELALNINAPEVISSMGIITLRCKCPNKNILLGQMGMPLECPSCKKVWLVSAKMTVEVREVRIDLPKQLTSIGN